MILVGLALVPLCAVGALTALIRVLVMALPGRPAPWPIHLTRRAAWLVAAVAAFVYSLGLLSVSWSEHDYNNGADSVPAPACRDGFEPAVREGLSHHESSYLPLRFDCVREDGTSYPSDPDLTWINWTAMSLALTAGLLAVGAGALRK